MRSFLFGKLSGLNDKNAALAAGYSVSVAENTKERIWKPHVRAEFERLLQMRVSVVTQDGLQNQIESKPAIEAEWPASKNDRGMENVAQAGMGCLRARKWVRGNKSSEKKGMAGRKNRGENGNDGAGLRGPAKSTGGVYNVDPENSCDRIVRRIVVHWNARNVVRATAQPARSTKTAAGDAVDQRKSNGYWRPLLHLGNGYRWEHAVCGR